MARAVPSRLRQHDGARRPFHEQYGREPDRGPRAALAEFDRLAGAASLDGAVKDRRRRAIRLVGAVAERGLFLGQQPGRKRAVPVL